MEIEINKLKEIAVEYFDVGDEEKLKNDWIDFMYCYHRMRNCPCVEARDIGSLIDSLYLVASDIASNDFFKTTEDRFGNKFYNYEEKYKSLDYIVDDALYRIYEENAIPSLSEQYVYVKRLER